MHFGKVRFKVGFHFSIYLGAWQTFYIYYLSVARVYIIMVLCLNDVKNKALKMALMDLSASLKEFKHIV